MPGEDLKRSKRRFIIFKKKKRKVRTLTLSMNEIPVEKGLTCKRFHTSYAVSSIRTASKCFERDAMCSSSNLKFLKFALRETFEKGRLCVWRWCIFFFVVLSLVMSVRE